jgi:hypothetical protein
MFANRSRTIDSDSIASAHSFENLLLAMSDIDPFIDWAADADVTQVKKILDVDALAKGWSNAKVTGVSWLSVPCEAVDVCTMSL